MRQQFSRCKRCKKLYSLEHDTLCPQGWKTTSAVSLEQIIHVWNYEIWDNCNEALKRKRYFYTSLRHKFLRNTKNLLIIPQVGTLKVPTFPNSSKHLTCGSLSIIFLLSTICLHSKHFLILSPHLAHMMTWPHGPNSKLALASSHNIHNVSGAGTPAACSDSSILKWTFRHSGTFLHTWQASGSGQECFLEYRILL